MSETSIKPISGVRLTPSNPPVRAQSPNPADSMTVSKPSTPEQNKTLQHSEKKSAPANDLSNISIHFRVNEDSNELTVFIVDRKSKRVLRSIPASEFYKLQADDLLKLTA